MVEFQVIPTEFTSCGELLKGNFLIPTCEGPFLGICKFHGLPGSNNQIRGIASRLASAGFAVLTFDFRGFRSSGGIFSLANEVEDAQRAISHLLTSECVVKDWVGVYGASYGGAVAVLAASRDQRISAVCLRAPVYDTLKFASSSLIQPAVDSLLENFPYVIHGLVEPLTRKRILNEMIEDARELNPVMEIEKIAPRPLMIITGDSDEEIKSNGVRRFYRLAKEPKELRIIENGDHELSDPRAFDKTMNTAVDWFIEQKRMREKRRCR